MKSKLRASWPAGAALLLILTCAWAFAEKRYPLTQQPSCCAVVEEALRHASRIKVGMTRGEVEKYLQREGGLQFPDKTRYTSPKCPYLKLEVEFEISPRPEELFSPKDIVKGVAKPLYVAYPIFD